MKKKLLALLAVPCALCCAFGMTACSDDSAKKNHTEEQWQTAISTPITEAKSFHISEGCDEVHSDGTVKTISSADIYVYKDPVNTYYYMVSEDENDEYKSYLLKMGDRYYQSYNEKFTTEISAQAFAETEAYTRGIISTAQSFIDQLKPLYDEFDMRASGGFSYTENESGVDGMVDYSGYVADNIEFTVTRDGDTHKMTAGMVDVDLDDETGALVSVYIRELLVEDDESDVKQLATISYKNDYGALPFKLPNLPEFVGKTFELVDATVDNNAYEEAILGSIPDNTNIVQLNDGKTVTFNADGTFTGDIEFNGISITTYTWTDKIGDLTISNVNNAQVPAEGKTTLHGGIEILGTEYEGSEYYSLILESELDLGDTTVTLTLELWYVQDDK